MVSLSQQQIEQFRSEGFLIVPAFFTKEETTVLQNQVRQWVETGKLKNVATDGDGKTPSADIQNLQLVPLDVHSGLFRALPFQRRVLASVRQLIGDPVTKILDQLFYKPAKTGGPTNWHTDNAYFRIKDPLKGMALWIAIDDANIENGALKVIPSQFDTKFPHARDPDSDHHIRMHADESSAVHCELSAGGVVFFCFGTPHATGANNSATARSGAGIHFVNAECGNDFLLKGERAKQNVVLTGEGVTGGFENYGEDVSGSWAAEVSRLL